MFCCPKLIGTTGTTGTHVAVNRSPASSSLYEAKVIGLACYHQQFFGSLTAEIQESEVLCVARTGECRIERAIILSYHINPQKLQHMRIALVLIGLLPDGTLYESVVFLAVPGDGTGAYLTNFHPAFPSGEQLQVYTQFSSGINVLEEQVSTSIPAICVAEKFGVLPAECNCKWFATVLKVVPENFSKCLRFVCP